MRPNYLWMAVTPDEYELPLAVADSARQLGEMLGVSKENVMSLVSKKSNGKKSGRKFVKVRV